MATYTASSTWADKTEWRFPIALLLHACRLAGRRLIIHRMLSVRNIVYVIPEPRTHSGVIHVEAHHRRSRRLERAPAVAGLTSHA